MKMLHVFNPEHDIALASDLSNFTAPHAGRQLRTDLAFLPALWAAEDDAVLVDNVEQALCGYRHLRPDATLCPHFVTKNQLSSLDIRCVSPWGWDRALRAQLLRYGVKTVPSEDYVAMVRRLSHRRTASQLLPLLRTEGTVGQSFECTEPTEVERLLSTYGSVVMKAPWSSSGRGLRFLSQSQTPFSTQANWFSNMVKAQGSVMVEPFYNKVKDFGMEFEVDAAGKVHYLGLSLFHTKNGAYIGNLLATEESKREQMACYVSLELLDEIKQHIIENVQLEDYVGPFGIDMMIVNSQFSILNSQLFLHPCVELNLRRTMGHVALSLTPADDDIQKVMQIELTDHYRLHIRKAQ